MPGWKTCPRSQFRPSRWRCPADWKRHRRRDKRRGAGRKFAWQVGVQNDGGTGNRNRAGSGTTLGGLAREAEDAGFSGIFVSESNNDAMMCCAEMARATSRIKLVTWIVNIHFRVPITCAAAAAMVQEISGGRFVLGLGVSHRPLLESLGIEMGHGRERLRAYTVELRRLLRGEALGAGVELRLSAPRHPVPIYYAALALETARLAGELADGVELYMCSAQRMSRLAQAAREAASSHGRKPSDVAITMGLPTFVHDDLERAMSVARRRLAFYGSLPFYNRQMARAGFEAEA
jgi:5,10-methylenetetrahydromethanopterin reductase